MLISLHIRKETAARVREITKNRDLTVDEHMNILLKPALKGVWLTCAVCGARVKADNMARHMEARAKKRNFNDLCHLSLSINDKHR